MCPDRPGPCRRRARPVVVVVALAVAVLAGCSGSGAGSGGLSPTTSTTAHVAPTTAGSGPTTTVAATSTGPTTGSTTSTAARLGGADALPMATGAIVVHPAVATVAGSVAGSLVTPDGRTRTFHLYVPPGLDRGGAMVPLLIALHGGFGTGLQFERNSGYDGLAQANRFIVVYPDGIGIGRAGGAVRTWNGGACCGPAVKQQVDDVGFVRQLIDHLEATEPVDPHRVVVTGHSNGGILAYRLACQLADRIVAIGVQSTSLELPACHPSRPVSVLHVHGTDDQNIPIAGGRGAKDVSRVSFASPLDGVGTVARADGCGAAGPPRVDPADTDVRVTTWTGCPAGTTVAFVRVAGANHAWMGHATGGSGMVGPPYLRIDSSLILWNFLSQQRR